MSAITDKTKLTSVIQTHITKVAGRYKGKVRSWDGVNEIFYEDGAFRSSVFFNVLGEQFVTVAFKAIRAADPTPSCTSTTSISANAKLKGLVNLVKNVNSSGAKLIDGVGSKSSTEYESVRTLVSSYDLHCRLVVLAAFNLP